MLVGVEWWLEGLYSFHTPDHVYVGHLNLFPQLYMDKEQKSGDASYMAAGSFLDPLSVTFLSELDQPRQHHQPHHACIAPTFKTAI